MERAWGPDVAQGAHLLTIKALCYKVTILSLPFIVINKTMEKGAVIWFVQ